MTLTWNFGERFEFWEKLHNRVGRKGLTSLAMTDQAELRCLHRDTCFLNIFTNIPEIRTY